jgi:peroxiredoxin Q/BCP
MLGIGDPAPDFTLTNQDGDAVSLRALRGRPVLVYFYPKASTPGCTQQACALRDARNDFGDAVVMGISPDKVTALRNFAAKQHLPFDLLSDPDHAVADAYSVWKEKKLYGKVYMGIERSAFLVGADGVLADVRYKISPVDTPGVLLDHLR